MSARISCGLASLRCCYRNQQLLLIHRFYFCDKCHNLRIFFKNYSSDNGNVLRTGAAADRERSNSEAGLRKASRSPPCPRGRTFATLGRCCCSVSGGRSRTKCPLRVRTGLEIRYQRDGRARLATWAPADTFALRQVVWLRVVLYNFN